MKKRASDWKYAKHSRKPNNPFGSVFFTSWQQMPTVFKTDCPSLSLSQRCSVVWKRQILMPEMMRLFTLSFPSIRKHSIWQWFFSLNTVTGFLCVGDSFDSWANFVLDAENSLLKGSNGGREREWIICFVGKYSFMHQTMKRVNEWKRELDYGWDST